MSTQAVRVRFAPSPTGYLHVGGARTAFYNFLYARKNKGQFLLRIEDTDTARSTEEAMRMQIADLQWLGLKWDEGPHPESLQDQGPHAPYRQSRRLSIYADVAAQLLREGKAYHCFLTDAELEEQRERLLKLGKPPHVESPYESWSLEKAEAHIKAGNAGVVRFKTRHLRKDYIVQDLVRGEVKFPSDMVGDFVLLRSGGMPVYNFCCVVDDHLMKISHVLRAEEHLSNTLRQVMIFEAMGWKPPQFGHLSLILDEERKKLSKRQGATSCHEFMLEGYLPEALLNFLVLLGWSHPDGKEILSLSEMIDSFSLDRLHVAGAVFDSKKLKWVNATHIRAKSDREIWQLIEPFLQRAGLEFPKDSKWQDQSVQVFKTGFETLLEAVEAYRPLLDFHVRPEADEVLAWPEARKAIEAWKTALQDSAEKIDETLFSALQDKVKNSAQVKGKQLFQPLRVAVLGMPHGAELKLVVPLLGRDELLRRADLVLAKMRS